MRPGTRSAPQPIKPSPDDSRSHEYASSPPEPVGMEYDGRDNVRLQRFEGSPYRPGSSYKSPITSPLRQQINTDLPRRISHTHSSSSIRHTQYEGDDSSPTEESISLLHRSPSKPNLRDGRVRIRPRGCALISIILACLSVAFLGLVAHSFLNLQRDPKGCRMSFMYPSYAKLSDFDTEHTRFATKYSLYLYREQKMDLSEEVLLSPFSTLIVAYWCPSFIHSRKCGQLSSSASDSRRSSCPILPRLSRQQFNSTRRHSQPRFLHWYLLPNFTLTISRF